MDSQKEYLNPLDEDAMFNTRPDALFIGDEAGQTMEEKVDELLSILRPLAPVIASLPDLLRKVDPFLESAKASPVLKMLGIKL